MLNIKEQNNIVIINLRVQPKASADRIIGEHDGALKIGVTAAPEGGKANDAVVKLLSKLLGVPKSNIEIISGHSGRNKRVALKGVSKEKIEEFINRE